MYICGYLFKMLQKTDKNSITSFSKSPQLHTSSMFDWPKQSFSGCQLNRVSLKLASCDKQFFLCALQGQGCGENHTRKKIKIEQVCRTLY